MATSARLLSRMQLRPIDPRQRPGPKTVPQRWTLERLAEATAALKFSEHRRKFVDRTGHVYSGEHKSIRALCVDNLFHLIGDLVDRDIARLSDK